MSNLDWLGEEIMSVFSENPVTANVSYLSSKRAQLSKLDRLQIMRSCSSLDGGNRATLARRLQIKPADFSVFLNVLSHL